jgi:flavin reductase (DIM6/NTAB) family NADH-FMN oxidoreductase RutF
MECALAQIVDLPTNEFYIGEIVADYADEDCLTDAVPDVEKIKPFTLTMPDNRYWQVGDLTGKAWRIGRQAER